AILVDVEIAEQVVDTLVPSGLERLAVDADVYPHQHRPTLAEEDEVLPIVRRLRRIGPLKGEAADHDDEATTNCQLPTANCMPQAGPSLTGLAVGSTMRMGRPTLETFCLVASTPSALATVPRKSSTLTGRSVTSMPLGEVLPMTWPPLMPPPARTVLH